MYKVPDPLWCRVKASFFYWFWCPIFGHKTITKMDGTSAFAVDSKSTLRRSEGEA